MALILRGTVNLYYYLNEEIADPRTQNWPLMRTPWPMIVLLGLYLATVLRWLPRYMENRPAYSLRKLIVFYNCFQIFFCAYVVYQSLKLGWLNHYSFLCQPVDHGPLAEEYAWKVCYGYMLVKLLDLFDTIFFILRKKHNQVSFLHVYHHFGIVIVAWGMVKWVPGGHATFLILINSFIHIIMYMYYLLTIWDDSYKQSIWWKKHVTQIQLIQFIITLFHYGVLIFAEECGFPRQPGYILFPQNLFIVFLFSDFYYRAYIKTNTSTKNK